MNNREELVVSFDNIYQFSGSFIETGKYLRPGGLRETVMGKAFKPFEHEDLELKNQLIEYARTICEKEEPDAKLASAMIYSSFAEYLGGHLLDNLRHFIYQATYREYAGILFIDQRKKKEVRNMKKITDYLRGYGFPDKEEILELFEQVAKSRNNLFHNFASADAKKFDIFEEDIQTIKEKTEELLVKVNTIYTGLSKILLNNPMGTSSEVWQATPQNGSSKHKTERGAKKS